MLAAGAVGTPHLLLRSGIGPADDLRAAGIEVRHDLPGVGRGFTDHPAVFLPFTTGDPPAHPHARAAQAALDLDAGADPAGDCEMLLFARPFAPGGPLHLMCQLMRPDSRGRLTLPAPDGPPRIAYRYLRTEHDRRRLRHAVRVAADLLRAGLGTRVGPAGAVLGSDRGLDGWIAAHLTTAQHLCGTAAMGSADDPLAVVDPALRVHGIERLRVVDLSVLPVAPRRGTAATAVAVGEAGGGVPGCPGRRDGRMNHMTDGSALLQRFGAADACAARLLCDDHPADDVAFTVVEPDLSARELTYGELGRESARFAAALADLGIGPGDRVAVLMSRSIELIVTLLGIWRRGAVLVPLSTALGRPAIATRLRAADVALVVVDADRRTKLAAGEGVPADPRWQVVVVRGEPGRRELSFEALMALYLDDSLPAAGRGRR